MSESLPDWTRGEPSFVVSTCVRCGNHWYLPHVHCPVCGSDDATATAAAGVGLCVAVTWLHVTVVDEGGPVSLTLVELDEGPVVMARTHDPDLAPGDRARIDFRPDGPDASLVPSFAREV